MSYREIKTARGYPLDEVASAFQKSIRRNDARLAIYFGLELFASGMSGYAWRRLLVTSAEDCAGPLTQEIEALYRAHELVAKQRKPTRVFLAKAILLLCAAPKCRDADHAGAFVYDAKSGISDEQIEKALAESAGEKLPVPAYALDIHTARGRAAGKTKREFFREEYGNLQPRQTGLFDHDVEE